MRGWHLASRIGGTPAFVIILVITAVTLASWRAYSSANANPAGFELQVSNATAKGDRLALAAQPQQSFTLASADSRAVTLTERPRAAPVPEKAMALVPEKPAVVAALPQQQDKPKRPAPAAATGLFDEGQIAGFKGRLRLTASQAEYWPAVEAALRDVIRQQARRKTAPGAAPRIDVNSVEVQRLISAALPLLMQLREDQKQEVRTLARVIGLDNVASQI